MQIYLDDIRRAPKGHVLTKTAKETIKLLSTEKNIRSVSLDHDLGDEKKYGTGYDVLLWIEKQVYTTDYKPPVLKVHSANVSARQKMDLAIIAIENIYRTKHLPKVSDTVPIEWIHVDDGLPIIPFNQFAISVLIIMYDHQFAEACERHNWGDTGYSVYHAHYGALADREGKKSKYFENSDKEFDFECLENLGEGTDWCPTSDPVVYWAYYPKFPKELKLSKEVKEHIAFNEYYHKRGDEIDAKTLTMNELQKEFDVIWKNQNCKDLD